jgi:hypothetical protein
MKKEEGGERRRQLKRKIERLKKEKIDIETKRRKGRLRKNNGRERRREGGEEERERKEISKC